MDDGEAMTMKDTMHQDDATDATVPEAPEPEVPEAPEAPEAPTASDDNHYIDFDLPSLDSDAARQVEHPAWPWVCLSADGDGVAVDYTGLSVG